MSDGPVHDIEGPGAAVSHPGQGRWLAASRAPVPASEATAAGGGIIHGLDKGLDRLPAAQRLAALALIG